MDPYKLIEGDYREEDTITMIDHHELTVADHDIDIVTFQVDHPRFGTESGDGFRHPAWTEIRSHLFKNGNPIFGAIIESEVHWPQRKDN